MRRFVGLLVALAAIGFIVAGCQSYEAGVEVICEGPNNCPECASAMPENQANFVAKNIEKDLSNGDAKKLFESYSMMAPAERVTSLRAEADRAGLASCPMADHWAEAATSSEE